jgi:hypothetical protein
MPVVIRVQARGQAVTYAAVAVGRNRAAAEKTLPIALRFQSGFPSHAIFLYQSFFPSSTTRKYSSISRGV